MKLTAKQVEVMDSYTAGYRNGACSIEDSLEDIPKLHARKMELEIAYRLGWDVGHQHVGLILHNIKDIVGQANAPLN